MLTNGLRKWSKNLSKMGEKMNINITNMNYKQVCDIAISFNEVAIKRYDNVVKLVVLRA